jgi:AraC-like DNA-binding protein
MKISVIDKEGSGIMSQFASAIGATVKGRFYYIPKDKGDGYITGFSWQNNSLRMMVRNYYLKEEVLLERTNVLAEGQEDVIFLLSGIFPLLQNDKQPLPEQPSVLICMHAVSSQLTMPSNTFFSSIAIAVSRRYLLEHFGNLTHPVVVSVLKGSDNFAFEIGISPEMIKTASEIVLHPVPKSLESQYCRLKCEELLCYIFSLLVQREAIPLSGMHIHDIKAVYAIKHRLQLQFDKAPNIALLAKDAGMSGPKLRKLFKQTFGKGVFEYYQYMRMQEAARLLREQHLSVSEAGYQIGFTNLSHFTRVFEQHIGMKPKKYSAM